MKAMMIIIALGSLYVNAHAAAESLSSVSSDFPQPSSEQSNSPREPLIEVLKKKQQTAHETESHEAALRRMQDDLKWAATQDRPSYQGHEEGSRW